MGFGNLIDAGGQDALTSFQQSTNTIGGDMQEQAANVEAASEDQEANETWQQTQYNAISTSLQTEQAYGQQAEQYASAGVDLNGTPLAQMNQTRMVGNMQVNAIEQAGQLQASLYRTQADQAQQTGLSDMLSAEGENQITGEQNQISQFQQKAALAESFLGIGGQVVGGLLSG